MGLKPEQITRALSRKLLGKRHDRIMMAYYTAKLPRLKFPKTPEEWERRTARTRHRVGTRG